MADEERDIPQLDELATDITVQIELLDKTPPEQVTPEFLHGVLRNTVLPLLKDLAESADANFVELSDLVDPLKISRGRAAEIKELLQSFKVASPGQSLLHERIDESLVDLDDDEPDDEEETEES